jgi:hypothetical protein
MVWAYAGFTLWATLIIGTLHNLEEVAMTLILPWWTFDVVTIQKALQIRKQELSAGYAESYLHTPNL